MEAPRHRCVVCGAKTESNLTRFCGTCHPPVCVCPTPDPDGVGECRQCLMGHTPGLMETRAAYIEYLDRKGVERGAGFFIVAGR